MNKVHGGLCGAHQPGPKLYNQIKIVGWEVPLANNGIRLHGP